MNSDGYNPAHSEEPPSYYPPYNPNINTNNIQTVPSDNPPQNNMCPPIFQNQTQLINACTQFSTSTADGTNLNPQLVQQLFRQATEVKGNLEEVINVLNNILRNPRQNQDEITPGPNSVLPNHHQMGPLNQGYQFHGNNISAQQNPRYCNGNINRYVTSYQGINIERLLRRLQKCRDQSETSGLSSSTTPSSSDNNNYKKSPNWPPVYPVSDNNANNSSTSEGTLKSLLLECSNSYIPNQSNIHYKSSSSSVSSSKSNRKLKSPIYRSDRSVYSKKSSNGSKSNYSGPSSTSRRSSDLFDSGTDTSASVQPNKLTASYNELYFNNNLSNQMLSSTNLYSNLENLPECPTEPSSKYSPVNDVQICANIPKTKCEELRVKSSDDSSKESDNSSVVLKGPAQKKLNRLPSLSTQISCTLNGCSVRITEQPEENHRARYMTEGSRGAVKNRSGNGFPTVQISGWKGPINLHIFIAAEDGRIRPHRSYITCNVLGKIQCNSKEKNFDKTPIIEIPLESNNNNSRTVIIDCIGITKLRNVDIERNGLPRFKKKSTMARIGIRANLINVDGTYTTIQCISSQILCTQPIGCPEISRISRIEGPCSGSIELFIIGKNFSKGAKVIFEERNQIGEIKWKSEAKVDYNLFQQNHIVCYTPAYPILTIEHPVTVQLYVACQDRHSEPHCFTYNPIYPDQTNVFNRPMNWKENPFHLQKKNSFQIDHDGPNILTKSTINSFNQNRAVNQHVVEFTQPNPLPQDITTTMAQLSIPVISPRVNSTTAVTNWLAQTNNSSTDSSKYWQNMDVSNKKSIMEPCYSARMSSLGTQLPKNESSNVPHNLIQNNGNITTLSDGSAAEIYVPFTNINSTTGSTNQFGSMSTLTESVEMIDNILS